MASTLAGILSRFWHSLGEEVKENIEKLADAAAPFAWGAWIFSHVTQINEALQTIALLAAIFASVAAGWYHLKKARRLR